MGTKKGNNNLNMGGGEVYMKVDFVTGRKGTLGCKLQKSPKFYNHTLSYLSSQKKMFFSKLEESNFSTNDFNL